MTKKISTKRKKSPHQLKQAVKERLGSALSEDDIMPHPIHWQEGQDWLRGYNTAIDEMERAQNDEHYSRQVTDELRAEKSFIRGKSEAYYQMRQMAKHGIAGLLLIILGACLILMAIYG